MKRKLTYRLLTIFGKLSVEVGLYIDPTKRFPNGEYSSQSQEGTYFTGINLQPSLTIGIIRPSETDENGNRSRAPFNKNDNLLMAANQLPIFLKELEAIIAAMRIPEMYSYAGKRLVVNDDLVLQHRRLFTIGAGQVASTIEIVPVVILQPDETRIEGIQMKFNDDHSTVLLTLNDLEVLSHYLKVADINGIALTMYANWCKGPPPATVPSVSPRPQPGYPRTGPRIDTYAPGLETEADPKSDDQL
jgi:hypothetical protein